MVPDTVKNDIQKIADALLNAQTGDTPLTVTGGGGGTEYTEGATDASITGSAILWEDTSDTLRSVSAAKPLPVNIISGAGSGGTASADDADFVAGTTSGTPAMGVYESTPTSVTDGDLGVAGITSDRKLKVQADLGATDNAVLDAIAASVAAADTDLTTIIGHVDGVETALTAANASLDAIEASTAAMDTDLTTIIGHVDGIETLIGTTNTNTGAATTALQLIDDTVATLGTTTYTEATTKGNVIGAVRRDADTTLVDTTNEIGPLQMDANGRLKVEAFSGETLPVSLASTTVTGTVAVTQSGTWDEVGINDSGNSITVDYATTGSGTSTGAIRVELPTNGTGVIAVVGSVTSITNALPAGTNAIGKLAANSGVDIGDVDITSIAAGDNNIGNVDIVTMPGVVGTVADDATTPGNPVMIGGKAVSPDGTTPTAVAENDVAIFRTDLNRRLLVNNRSPQWWSFHSDGSSALTDSSVQADPGDGFEIVITEITFSTGAATACNIFFEEGSTKILGPWYLEAVAGRGLVWRGEKHVTASTALTVTTSAAIAQSLDVQGYIQAV